MENKQIVTNFSDQDLYSWSVCLFYLNHFPNMNLRYDFIDRNKTVYPEGFLEKLNEQIKGMDGLKMTREEIEGLKHFTSTYFPSWFYIFLEGLELKSDEVKMWIEEDGTLHGTIEGPAWRTVFWEQLLLATISELYHREIGDFEFYDLNTETSFTKSKGALLMSNGCNFCDMGTRRRFSKEHHKMVVETLCESYDTSDINKSGKFMGTSNLWLAIKLKEKYPWIKCIGTMSHQVISVCAAVFGPREANKIAMQKWYESYKGNLGIYLFDCLGEKAFYNNFSRENAKLWDGYRIDSGDNLDQFEKLHKRLLEFRMDPSKIGCVFSNGLKVWDSIDIHSKIGGAMMDSYGIGTELTCGMQDSRIKPCNMVIKATGCQLTPKSEWLNCIKLSCDEGKACGDPDTVKAYRTLIG